MSIRWWEKTVEYKFVMEVARAERLFLAPLDGGHERAGDAIFSSNNRWVLIEFKKDSAAIRSEMEKFTRYLEAKAALSSCDSHHYIVFGQASSSSPACLELCARTYFSEKEGDILASGQLFHEFKKYVEQYIKFKKGPKGGGGTGMAMEDFALVAGVNADNDVVECLSLSEFQRQLGLELQHERYISKGFDGPSW